MNEIDEQQVARLIAELPPPPRGWTEAAYEIPVTQAELDRVIERIEADEQFRTAVQAGLDKALVDAGIEPSDALMAGLRRHLATGE